MLTLQGNQMKNVVFVHIIAGRLTHVLYYTAITSILYMNQLLKQEILFHKIKKHKGDFREISGKLLYITSLYTNRALDFSVL